MTEITNLNDLEIYQESSKLVKLLFDLCKNPLLKREYSLCDQLKRAAISVCANIAEGFGRRTKSDFAQFLSIALGSCNEVIALIDVIMLNFSDIKTNSIRESYEVLGRRIYSFRKTLIS